MHEKSYDCTVDFQARSTLHALGLDYPGQHDDDDVLIDDGRRMASLPFGML